MFKRKFSRRIGGNTSTRYSKCNKDYSIQNCRRFERKFVARRTLAYVRRRTNEVRNDATSTFWRKGVDRSLSHVHIYFNWYIVQSYASHRSRIKCIKIFTTGFIIYIVQRKLWRQSGCNRTFMRFERTRIHWRMNVRPNSNKKLTNY